MFWCIGFGVGVVGREVVLHLIFVVGFRLSLNVSEQNWLTVGRESTVVSHDFQKTGGGNRNRFFCRSRRCCVLTTSTS
jgi:hypothetical protein